MTELGDRRRSWAANAASLWMLFFGLLHVYWVLGGSIGLPSGISLRGSTGLFVASLMAVPLCATGVLLALALRHPGRGGGPRRILLVAGWFASGIMFVHAVPALVELAILLARGEVYGLSQRQRFSLWLYEPFWFLGGVLFAVASFRYGRSP